MPSFYAATLWASWLALYFARLIRWDETSLTGNVLFFGALVAFAISMSLLSSRYQASLDIVENADQGGRATAETQILLGVLHAVGLIGIAKYSWDFASSLGGPTEFAVLLMSAPYRIRWQAELTSSVGTQISYCGWIAIALTVWLLQRRALSFAWLIIAILQLGANLVFIDRTRPIWILFTSAAILLPGAARISGRTLIRLACIGAVGTALVFVTIGVWIGKISDELPFGATNLQPGLENVYYYGTSGFAYFTKIIQAEHQFEYVPVRTGYPIVKLLSAVGLVASPPSQINEFYSVPFETNVGTFLEPFYRDGGIPFSIAGIALASFGVDSLALFLWRRGTAMSSFAAANLCFASATAFFSPKLASFPLWVFCVIGFLVGKRVRREQHNEAGKEMSTVRSTMHVSKARRRLLFVVNQPRFFLSHRLMLAVAAREKGFDVHVATPPGEGEDGLRASGFGVHLLPLKRRSLNPWTEARCLLALLKVLRRVRPDVVHNVTVKPVIYGGLVGRILRIPRVINEISGLGYVFLEKGIRGFLIRIVVAPAYRFACKNPRSRTVCQNDDDLAELSMLRLVDRDKAVVIRGSCVDLSPFQPSPEPRRNVPLVVLPGRMLKDKGVVEFVQAATILRDRGVLAEFGLVGDTDEGNPAAISRAQLENWSESCAVKWWGFQSDMADVFNKATVVCLPSYREGSPRVLIEAAASARAIVATDVPGCRDIVRHEETGLLVPPKNATMLAEAIQRMLVDTSLRKRLAESACELARREFATETVIARTLPHYAVDGATSP